MVDSGHLQYFTGELSQQNFMSPNIWSHLRTRLVVGIGVLLLVSYLASPYRNGTRPNPKRSAQHVCHDVAAAISAYVDEYHSLPLVSYDLKTDLSLDSTESIALFGILSAHAPPELNPKHINFIEGIKQAKYSHGKFLDGMNYEEDETRPTLIDPWGKAYRITLDTNEDGFIENPQTPGTKLASEKALVYSAGPDGDFSTWQDNLRSW
jgi:hypothetical protein